jgi:GTPase SAR1 family protein
MIALPVADSFVGKTRLIRMFVDGGARDDYESVCFQPQIPSCTHYSAPLYVVNLQTIGIDYMDKRLDVKGHPVYLQLWDTAGQERFRALTSNFYNRAHVRALRRIL